MVIKDLYPTEAQVLLNKNVDPLELMVTSIRELQLLNILDITLSEKSRRPIDFQISRGEKFLTASDLNHYQSLFVEKIVAYEERQADPETLLEPELTIEYLVELIGKHYDNLPKAGMSIYRTKILESLRDKGLYGTFLLFFTRWTDAGESLKSELEDQLSRLEVVASDDSMIGYSEQRNLIQSLGMNFIISKKLNRKAYENLAKALKHDRADWSGVGGTYILDMVDHQSSEVFTDAFFTNAFDAMAWFDLSELTD